MGRVSDIDFSLSSQHFGLHFTFISQTLSKMTTDLAVPAPIANGSTSSNGHTRSNPEHGQSSMPGVFGGSADTAEEYQYLDLIARIIASGQPRPDRTGTGTLALFAPPSLRFSLATDTLPLLTTKRVFLRGVWEELLWFVSGCTDGKKLSAQGVNIWEGNGSREYLDRVGLGHRREGDLGPVYGFQWRHFGAPYGTCEDDYSGQGVDQLAEVVRKIRENPTDRRIVLSAWNPKGEPPSRFLIRVDNGC